LIQLDVSSNAFGPEGGRLIHDALEHNTVLRAMAGGHAQAFLTFS
jgi:hypothetical protein